MCIRDSNYYVVSVIGDGALTGGMAYEAMNNASRMKTNFIIVLNDNQMSIDVYKRQCILMTEESQRRERMKN